MTQNHIIKKQIVEIALDSEIGSFTFQSMISELFNAEIIPLIDAFCSEIDTGSGVLRIDKLEIDLGRIDRRNFNGDFRQKFNEIFPKKLMETVDRIVLYSSGLPNDDFHSVPSVAETTRELGLLEYFIKEGRLPWWVKKDEIYDIPALLELYVSQEPLKIKNIMAEIAGHPARVKRLVYLISAPVLEKIIGLFQQQYSQKIGTLSRRLIAGLAECPLLDSYNPSRIEPEVWAVILALTATSNQLLLSAILAPIAKTAGVNYTELYDYVAKDLMAKGPVVADEVILPDIFQIQTKGWEIAGQPVTAAIDGLTIKEYICRLEIINRLLNELQLKLLDQKRATKIICSAQGVLDRLIYELPPIIKAIQYLENMIDDAREKMDDENIWIRLTGKNGHLERQVQELAYQLAGLQADLAVIFNENQFAADYDLMKELVKTVEAIRNMGAKEIVPETISTVDSFADSQEIYIRNAGLVLCWPYLPMFFEALGLFENNRFKNEEAPERAVFLLHYLVFGAGEIPEYQLMLNKILCGIDPGAPVNPLGRISETEIKECENLLQSVINHWSVLKNVTVPGFQSMFLKREGIIIARDGHWVLRVQEQAHDVLLDKMPWGINTVKLPWMPELLFVEWRL
jgi:hypothetical protein